MKPPLLLATTALLMGCEQLEPFLPDVAFERMEVTAIDFQQVSAEFIFAIDNPNPVDIELARFSYDLSLEQVSLLSGTDPDGLLLSASGASELRFPATVVYANVYEAIDATRGQDDVAFALVGELGFDTPIGPIDLPYDAQGSFPAARAPKVRLGALRLGQFNIVNLSATVELDLLIDNDHGSAIELIDLTYALDLSAVAVASGQIDLSDVVPGASERTVTLPLTLDLLNVGVSVLTALGSGGTLDVGFEATAQIDTPFGVLPLRIDQTGDLRVE